MSRNPKDDGQDKDFVKRLERYHNEQLKLRAKGEPNDLDEDFHEILHGFKVTSHVWNRLYNYQKTGVRWLIKLHDQYVGGILADEMGLGKTIQVAVFLRAVAESRQFSRIFDYTGLGPVLILTPATLMHQWVRELNIWFPKARVAVFHTTGSYTGSRKALLRKISTPRENGSILVTSYTTYTMFHKDIQKINWHYVILDEGHKIRNPDTKTAMSLKELRTPHRLLLSGSPLQNNLRELWSLVDFVYPGRLGALKEFTERFATPITRGGYANATKIEVRAAYKCACLLRDAINPYMLQRFKKDVEMVLHLPEKSEQVLFCDLTPHQRDLYKEYITSKETRSILAGKLDAFVGLITLRKLCNHPDLVTGGPNRDNEFDTSKDVEKEFGAPTRSGKMIVVQSLLKLWKKQGQKVLLFSQSRQMLTILEKLVIMLGYDYLRMDGATSIGSRQGLVKRFNEDPNIFVFLLTTRVGGLGLNLTSANRVVIYDPDWNPSTDAQARERAWRIGQNRAVTIYRLMTSGTIEEKIYQRQIFKQFLANRILIDPKQKRFFKMNDLHELFTLGDERVDKEHGTETAAIFSHKPTEINRKNFFDELARKKKKDKRQKQNRAQEEEEDEEDIDDLDNVEITLTEEYKEQLREKARLYAQMLAEMEKEGAITTIEQIEESAQQQQQANVSSEATTTNEASTSKSSTEFPAPAATTNNISAAMLEEPEEGEIASDGEAAVAEAEPEVVKVDAPASATETKESEMREDEKSRKHKKKKRDKKEKKYKKRLLDGKFEIKYLRKQKAYKPHKEDEKQSKDQDEYVLKHLLEKAGVHSAILHDKIINESNEDRVDIQLIEDEADAVAKRAAEVLKRAHQQHRNFVEMACASKKSVFGRRKALVPVDEDDETPTSSKKPSGSSSPATTTSKERFSNEPDGLPEMFNGGMKKRKATTAPATDDAFDDLFGGSALSSNQLGAIIKKRRADQLENLEAVDEDENADVDPELRRFPSLIPKQKKLDISLGDKYEKLAEEIRLFFIKKDGRATTNQVIEKFKSKIPPQDSFVFRSILRRICLQLPNSHWALREEYSKA